MSIDRRPVDRGSAYGGTGRGEEGVALPLALFVVLVLAGLGAALAQLTLTELTIGHRTRWDAQAQYLAQAALEHQLFALKDDKDAGAIGPTNFPVTPGQEFWYSTTLTCLLQCGVNREHRRWEVVATGEIRRREPDLSFTVLQTRALRARVEIRYAGSGALLFRQPTRVTCCAGRRSTPEGRQRGARSDQSET